MSHSEAYIKGYYAYCLGSDESENPYQKDSHDWKEWKRGLWAAYIDDIDGVEW